MDYILDINNHAWGRSSGQTSSSSSNKNGEISSRKSTTSDENKISDTNNPAPDIKTHQSGESSQSSIRRWIYPLDQTYVSDKSLSDSARNSYEMGHKSSNLVETDPGSDKLENENSERKGSIVAWLNPWDTSQQRHSQDSGNYIPELDKEKDSNTQSSSRHSIINWMFTSDSSNETKRNSTDSTQCNPVAENVENAHEGGDRRSSLKKFFLPAIKSHSSEKVHPRKPSKTSSLPIVLAPRSPERKTTPLSRSIFIYVFSVFRNFVFFFLKSGLTSMMFMSDLILNFAIYVLAGVMHIPGASTVGAAAKAALFLSQLLIWLLYSSVELLFFIPTYLQLPYIMFVILLYIYTPEFVKEYTISLFWASARFFHFVKKMMYD
ncbi:hypothetical protein Btru_038642 [Bulinus truncatus]|nr:hypothetical protein Btru_038642 [Bulinus truncatus]